MENRKAIDVKIIDISTSGIMADYFIIATAQSNLHLRALADECREKLPEKPRRMEGYPSTEWILMDYGDIVVHLFLENTRAFYALEELWS